MKEERKEIVDYIREYTQSEYARKIIGADILINEDGFDLWSFKKLIFLEYYIKPYLQILEGMQVYLFGYVL